MHELPRAAAQVHSLRFGSSLPNRVELASPSWVAGHWVRLVVEADRIRALELERGDGPGAARIVVRSARAGKPRRCLCVHTTRPALRRSACLGVVLFLDPQGEQQHADRIGIASYPLTAGGRTAARSSRRLDAPEGKHDKPIWRAQGLRAASAGVDPKRGSKSYAGFRKCYGLGLGRNPSLEGRVTTRFVVGLDGTVSNAANDGSDLERSASDRVRHFAVLQARIPATRRRHRHCRLSDHAVARLICREAN